MMRNFRIMTKDKPVYICFDCGNKARKGRGDKDRVVTCHEAKCDICGEKTSVCHVRNFGYRAVDEYLLTLTKEK